MRAIKFRVWCKDRHEWEKDRTYLSEDGTLLHQCQGYLQSYKPDNHIVQQFTGLLDKNGKEIYDGDVVRAIFNSSTHTVEWRNDQSQWSIGGFGQWEVIGNIYESSELVKKEAGK